MKPPTRRAALDRAPLERLTLAAVLAPGPRCSSLRGPASLASRCWSASSGAQGRRRASQPLGAAAVPGTLAVPLALITWASSGLNRTCWRRSASPSTQSALEYHLRQRRGADGVAAYRVCLPPSVLLQRLRLAGASTCSPTSPGPRPRASWRCSSTSAAPSSSCSMDRRRGRGAASTAASPEHLDRLAAAFHRRAGAARRVRAHQRHARVGGDHRLPVARHSRWWVLGPITGLATIISGGGLRAGVGPHRARALSSPAAPSKRPSSRARAGAHRQRGTTCCGRFARMGALKLPVFLMFVSIFRQYRHRGPIGAPYWGHSRCGLWIEARWASRRE